MSVDRASRFTWETSDKLEHAKASCGVLLATAGSIKCVYLKALEKMAFLTDPKQVAQVSPSTAFDLRALVRSVDLFRRASCLIMDEVRCFVQGPSEPEGAASHVRTRKHLYHAPHVLHRSIFFFTHSNRSSTSQLAQSFPVRECAA